MRSPLQGEHGRLEPGAGQARELGLRHEVEAVVPIAAARVTRAVPALQLGAAPRKLQAVAADGAALSPSPEVRRSAFVPAVQAAAQPFRARC